MTHEELCTFINGELNSTILDTTQCENADGGTEHTASVKDMISRFEKSAISYGVACESRGQMKESSFVSLTSIFNPIQAHFLHLPSPTSSQDRNSNVSVNSLLSNVSEISFESSSSGFASDRKSGPDNFLSYNKKTLLPTTIVYDCSSPGSRSPDHEDNISYRRFSFATTSTSPVVFRRTRQPPVIRRKSTIANQANTAETHWSYGVKQSDLESLLRLKKSDISDDEQDTHNVTIRKQTEIESITIDYNRNSGNDLMTLKSKCDDSHSEIASAEQSSITLVFEDNSDGDNASVTSDLFETKSSFDDVSVKSVSSIERYDSVTLSSDEFGSEVYNVQNSDYLPVSAVNEWCLNKNRAHLLLPAETKKEKYKRRLTERVNELLHTESVYVERLRHVVENYIPEMDREDLPDSLRGSKADIFSNIERIFRFHAEEFLPALRDCEKDLRRLGRCFRTFEKRFNLYVMYSRNNKRATRLVYEHKPFFQDKQSKLGDRLDLSSYLLEPVQRIPRYKLFLDELVKTYLSFENELSEPHLRISEQCPENDDCDDEEPLEKETALISLKKAKHMVERVLTAIDGIMALENISDIPEHINLLHQGQLLRQGEMWATESARRRRRLMRLFLFDKLLLLTAVYRKQAVEQFVYKDHIPVDELGITAKEHDEHKFTIWYKKRSLKSYKLESKDPAVRHDWVEDITSLLWEQAMQKKEHLLRERGKRLSMLSANSQGSIDYENDDKYNSLRGVPGEVSRSCEKKNRRTTWYCE